jgi:phospholipid/cholesterol/gamma-HCH transport system substrate-binding protein
MPERDDDLPPAPPSSHKDRALWVGVFVLVGVAAVLVALFTLTEPAMFRGRYIITTVVPDAGGVRRGDPVQMRGVNIGRVVRFKIGPEGVAIQLELEGEYDVPEDSRVLVHSLGVLQGMVAEVVPGSSTKAIGNKDTLPGETKGSMEGVDRVTKKAESVLSQAQEMLSKETIANVQASTGEARRLLIELQSMAAEQRKELIVVSRSLRRSSEGLEKISGDVEKATGGPELERTVKRVDALTARLDETTASLDRSTRSLESVLARIEKGEGTLGKLMRDDTLYANLNEAALNLSRLAEDVRREPKRYVKLSVF